MTDFRPDPVDELLAGLRVPPPPPDLADRIVAEARRIDRLPAAADIPARRSSGRPWTRRGVWTAVLAVNLALASAVAAAFGSGAIDGGRLVDAARHVVERITHTGSTRPTHTPVSHVLPRANSRAEALQGPSAEAALPVVGHPSDVRRLSAPRPAAPPRNFGTKPGHRLERAVRPRQARFHRVHPAWRPGPTAASGERILAQHRDSPREVWRAPPPHGRPFDRPRLRPRAFDGAHFDRPRGGPPPRFRGGGGFRGRWGGRRGGRPRRF